MASAVIRCPFCMDWRRPAHVGHSVMVCEGCGKTFRIVYAVGDKTGEKLGAMMKRAIRWK